MPLSGTLTLRKNYHRAIGGNVSYTGDLQARTTSFVVSVAGAFGFSGALQRSTAFKRAVGGILSFTGDLTTAVSAVNVAGVLSAMAGALTLRKNGVPVAVSRGLGVVIGKIKGIFFDKDIHL